MTTPLTGRVAVVTGAGQGLGRGIAQALAADGAAVTITDVDVSRAEATAALITDAGGHALAVHQDVLDLSSLADVIAATEARFGTVDIVVNNAGVARQTPILDVTEAEWDLVNDVNAKATFFACQTAGRYLRTRGRGGRIVNIASMTGKNAIPEYVAYNASKFSVIGITQTAALEFASDQVTVNAVCPGIVRTPLWDTLDPSQWDAQVARIPLGRGQTIEDIGDAVAFLASDRARSITGAALPVTGGLQMW